MPKERIALKQISDCDLEFLFRVYASTREEELKQTDWSDEIKLGFLSMQFHAQHTQYMENYPNKVFSLILYDDMPVGRLYLNRSINEIRIVDIAILPEYCGQGIGATLLKDIQQESTAKNITVSIHVEKYNPALNLYKRLGFEIVEDRDVYYFMEWKP